MADQVEFLEDKLSMLQDRVNDLTDDLYAADLEIIDKTASLKKQEMVSAEAVSGTNIFTAFASKKYSNFAFHLCL